MIKLEESSFWFPFGPFWTENFKIGFSPRESYQNIAGTVFHRTFTCESKKTQKTPQKKGLLVWYTRKTFRKTHFLTHTYVCVSESKKCCFFGKFCERTKWTIQKIFCLSLCLCLSLSLCLCLSLCDLCYMLCVMTPIWFILWELSFIEKGYISISEESIRKFDD